MAQLLSPRRHVRWQLIAPFAVLSIATAAVGTYMATSLVGGGVSDRFNAQLVEASRGTADAVARRERAHLEWLRSIAFTAGLPKAIQAHADDVEELVLPVTVNVGAELVHVLRPDGSVAFGVELADASTLTYRPSSFPASSWAPVASVLAASMDARGDKFAGVVTLGSDSWLVTAAPIPSANGSAGVAVVGTRLSTLARLARAESFADVVFFDAAALPLASTLTDRDGGSEAPAWLPPSVEAGALRDVEIGGRAYRLIAAPFEVRGARAGLTTVLLSTDLLAAVQDRTAGRMTTFFTIGFVLVVILGLAIAQQLTGAVSRLVGATRRVTNGDLTARAAVARDDELGELGRSFNVMTEALRDQLLGAVAALVSAIDARDAYTRGHSLRVGHLASLLGASLGLPPEECHHLEVGGYLHDVGKIGVRDHILLKPGDLSSDEREAIQSHPQVGLDILTSVGLPEPVLAGVYGHHERLDGSGYPRGLRGADVPIEARIVAVADFYDACITDRPYRKGMPVDLVLGILREEAEAGRLDGTVVDRMHAIAGGWERVWRNDERMSGFTLGHTAPATGLLVGSTV